tara:strand:+ start:116 stop:607 length:492 start_codon:yes stop_codon:yes gene_type:complete
MSNYGAAGSFWAAESWCVPMTNAGVKLSDKTQGLLMSEMTETQIEDWQNTLGVFTKWDRKLPGFGVRRQTENGCTSYIMKLRVCGKQKLITLGRVGILTLPEARAQAVGLLRQNYKDNLYWPVSNREPPHLTLYRIEKLVRDRIIDELADNELKFFGKETTDS